MPSGVTNNVGTLSGASATGGTVKTWVIVTGGITGAASGMGVISGVDVDMGYLVCVIRKSTSKKSASSVVEYVTVTISLNAPKVATSAGAKT